MDRCALKALEYLAPGCEITFFHSDSLCSLLYFALPVFVFASVLTLIAISVERYYAVVHPINAKIFSSKRRTIRIIASTWTVAVILALPYLYCKSYAFSISSHLGSISRYICTDRFDDIDLFMYGHLGPSGADADEAPPTGRFRKGFFMFLFVTMYVLPSAVILYTCVRIAIALGRPVSGILERSSTSYKVEDNKRKIARMVIVIAATFLILWSPFYLVTFVSQVQTVSFLTRSNFLFTMLSTHLVGFANSAVNPFVYAMLGDKFRTAFQRLAVEALTAVCCLQRTNYGRQIRRRLLASERSSPVDERSAASMQWSHPGRRPLIGPGGRQLNRRSFSATDVLRRNKKPLPVLAPLHSEGAAQPEIVTSNGFDQASKSKWMREVGKMTACVDDDRLENCSKPEVDSSRVSAGRQPSSAAFDDVACDRRHKQSMLVVVNSDSEQKSVLWENRKHNRPEIVSRDAITTGESRVSSVFLNRKQNEPTAASPTWLSMRRFGRSPSANDVTSGESTSTPMPPPPRSRTAVLTVCRQPSEPEHDGHVTTRRTTEVLTVARYHPKLGTMFVSDSLLSEPEDTFLADD